MKKILNSSPKFSNYLYFKFYIIFHKVNYQNIP